MYNAANKFIAALFVAASLASCGSSNKDQAMQLSATAENELKAGNYEAVVVLLDTLDNRYASEVEVRRSATKLRTMAVEGLTVRRIGVVDDSLAVLKQRLDQLESKFDYVDNPGKGLGGNYVCKSIAKLRSDILPRVNDDGYFTLSVKIPGRSIGFTDIVFVDGAESVSTTPVAADRLVKVENSEMTVLQQEDVEGVADWLAAHPATNRYELVGTKSTIKNKLSADMREAFVTTWQYAVTRQAYRLALIEREKLERKLQLYRDQLANMIDR